jgi:hypothetical protein
MTDFFTHCLQKWPAKALNAKHDFERAKTKITLHGFQRKRHNYGNTGVVRK